MKRVKVAPSILSADFTNLGRDINKVEAAGADWLHIDVMDGMFVPNITIGAPVVKSIRKITNLALDVHLMIVNPIRYVEDFANAGADYITVHVEACEENLKETIDLIKQKGVKAGVSVKPGTPAEKIRPVLNDLDLILVMTVEPGFGGQLFMVEMIPKIREIKKMLRENNLFNTCIEIDGGINAETAKLVKEAGADVLVAGSYIYNAENIAEAVNSLR
ncbi:MAG: ribulose-phosphate 3-epimerase [Candidatus Melainabacteria bacterium GWF2_37_15]|nr:MAG: ribulose-phosphate 3-epimerase [Candidatus Melainabacteria bacterium GWF2_37_15]